MSPNTFEDCFFLFPNSVKDAVGILIEAALNLHMDILGNTDILTILILLSGERKVSLIHGVGKTGQPTCRGMKPDP